MNGVATTGLLVAAIRAEESSRADRLFEDPFAAALAGDAGRAALAGYRAAAGRSIPVIEVRTRYLDEAVLRLTGAGVRQVVALAAGMDARAYRLPWPEGTRLLELDQPEVLAEKARILEAVPPRCQRVAVPANLAEDWPRALAAAGHDPAAPTVWTVEGVLQYLDAALVDSIFARIDALSARGSSVLYDVVGADLLAAPVLAPALRWMRELGAPWTFGTDQPATLVESRGWRAVVTESARIGWDWKRWPFPPAPPHLPKVPRGYFVEASRP